MAQSEGLNTKFPSLTLLAILIPITMFLHQLEEYFGHFPSWYSNLLKAQLSNNDFIVINSIGLLIIVLFALICIFSKNNFILMVLGTLVFVNGVTHFLLSLFTLTYSPGTITGVFLFIPLGTVIYKTVSTTLKKSELRFAMATGIIALFSVSIIAMNM